MKNKFILAVHVWRDGPAQALRDYLIKQKADFMWISHSLYYSKKVDGSGLELFKNGQKYRKKYSKAINLPLPLKYFSEALLNIWFVLFQKTEKDCLYIGYNSLNALSGIILRKLGKVSKAIYYCVDYTPKRFENKFLNLIFHKIDQFCVKHVDETWGLNETAMAAAREKYFKFDVYTKGYSRQKEVPMGFWKKRIEVKNFDEINKKQVVFMGTMLEKQGVQFVINAMPMILERIPDVKFVVIGDGVYLPQLKKMAEDLKLGNSIEFNGFVESHKEIEEMLLGSALAIAIYEEGNPETNFTYYTDQGKIKNYLGCGLPILLSSVPPISREIEANKCGVIIGNEPKEIADKIVEMLENETLLKSIRGNVLSYRNKFDWDVIFGKELDKYMKKKKKMKKVLILNHSQENFGTYYRCFFLAEGLSRKGYEITMICASGKKFDLLVKKRKINDNFSLITLPRIKYHRYLTGQIFFRLPIAALYVLFGSYDICHAFTLAQPQIALPAWIAKKIRRKKLVIDWDDAWGGGFALFHPWPIKQILTSFEKYFPRIADQVTYVSEFLGQKLEKLRIKNKTKIPNGCNTSEIKPLDRGECRKKLNIDPDAKILVSVGNTYMNCLGLFWKAFHESLERNPELFLYMVGETEVSKELKSIYAKIKKNVIFTGKRPFSEVPFYLGAADALILPMSNDDIEKARFPMRFGDYLCAGRPIISNAVGEIKYYLKKYDAGIVTGPDSSDEIKNGILKIISDEKLAEKISRNALEVSKILDWQKITDELSETYEKL
jgi:glycosyltransferase involved in cell wall biosynthesis